MELAEYLGRIWRRKWIVLGVAILAVGINVVVMFLLPRQYVATSLLEVGGIDSYLLNPGTARIDASQRQTLPSQIQGITQTYLDILDTPAVGEEAMQRVQRQLSLASQDNGNNGNTGTGTSNTNHDFTYVGQGSAGTQSGTDIISIDATADNPAVAKEAADALAMVLIEQSKKLSGDMVGSFVKDLQTQQVDPIQKRMVEIASESERVRVDPAIDATTRNARIAALNDEAETLDGMRKQYNDIIARVRINEQLSNNNLNLLSAAVTPASKETPPIVRSSVVAGVVGLIIAMMAVVVIDRRKVDKQAQIF